MNVQEVAAQYGEYLIEKRRYFHQHPEVSTKEYHTSKAIKEALDEIGVSWRPCGLETGVLVTIQGAKPGKTILLRGDMDALTVQETTGAPYASKNEGIMHACGHDCHIAMLLTATRILHDMKEELCGTVKLAFQPAEEVALGAKSMVEQGALDGVDACFAIHVWTDVKSGMVSLEAGPRMASADEFHITVKGKGCHGAQPERGVDAAVVTAAIINNLQSVVSREISPMDPAVVTVGTIQAGTRWNVVAENSYMTGTTRCFSNEVWETFEERMERVIKAQPRLTALRQSWSTCASCRPLSMMRRWFPSPKNPRLLSWVRIASHPIRLPPAAKTSPTSCRGCREQSHCWEPETRPAEPFGQTIPAISAWMRHSF